MWKPFDDLLVVAIEKNLKHLENIRDAKWSFIMGNLVIKMEQSLMWGYSGVDN